MPSITELLREKTRAQDSGKAAQKEEKSETTIIVYRIKRVHPKIVNVEIVDHVDVVLPIKETEIYVRLISNLNKNPTKQRWYPMIFWLDEKGYVTDFMPYRLWKERKEKEG